MQISTKGPYQLYINGEWTSAQDNRSFTVKNPSTLSNIGEVAFATETEAFKAIKAAKSAFYNIWSNVSPQERERYLNQVGALILENKDTLARIISLESGKPLKESLQEVAGSAENFYWYASESRRIKGEIIDTYQKNKKMYVTYHPAGVAALITPWNFPLNILSRKVASALAAGCTIVAKPSEETPIIAVLLWRILEKVNLPAGVANLVVGDPKSIGKEFMENPDTRVIGFTGSTIVGKLLMEQASKHVKKVALELGGHAPAIVFEDADLELSISNILSNKFRNAGQTCSCINRIYVHVNIYEEFVHLLKESMSRFKVGDGLNENTDVGPLINENALKKVDDHVKDAVYKGASIIKLSEEDGNVGSHLFYPPTLLTNVDHEMKIMSEETFGPVLPVVTFSNDDDVINKANDTPYGLYAFFFTKDVNRIMHVSEKLEYGMIGINEGLVTAVNAPMGGFKESGIGREGGKWGLEEFAEIKYVAINYGQ